MATVLIKKQVQVAEEIEIPAPSFWRNKYGGMYWVREDKTVLTVFRFGIFSGKVDDESFKMDFCNMEECDRQEFVDYLKATQRHLLSFTSTL
jgi:hypothetical protein